MVSDRDEFDGTEAGCPDDWQSQDEWLNGFFAADPAWLLGDDQLVLSTDGVVMSFERVEEDG